MAEQKKSESISDLQKRKQTLEDELKRVENQIFELEQSYLVETASFGNVVRGWDGFLQKKKNPDAPPKQAQPPKASERIFSLSSVTSPAEAAYQEELGAKSS
eukprot:tig00000865_g5078.t1